LETLEITCQSSGENLANGSYTSLIFSGLVIIFILYLVFSFHAAVATVPVAVVYGSSELRELVFELWAVAVGCGGGGGSFGVVRSGSDNWNGRWELHFHISNCIFQFWVSGRTVTKLDNNFKTERVLKYAGRYKYIVYTHRESVKRYKIERSRKLKHIYLENESGYNTLIVHLWIWYMGTSSVLVSGSSIFGFLD